MLLFVSFVSTIVICTLELYMWYVCVSIAQCIEYSGAIIGIECLHKLRNFCSKIEIEKKVSLLRIGRRTWVLWTIPFSSKLWYVRLQRPEIVQKIETSPLGNSKNWRPFSWSTWSMKCLIMNDECIVINCESVKQKWKWIWVGKRRQETTIKIIPEPPVTYTLKTFHHWNALRI